MGDRVLYQIYTRGPMGDVKEFSPSIYSHWGGENADENIADFTAWAARHPGEPEVCHAAAALAKIVDSRNSDDVLINNETRLLVASDGPGDRGLVRLRLNRRAVEVENL